MAVGMIGRAGAQRRRHEAAPAEALELVALAERLADALEALGPHPHQLTGRQQPLGVGVAGERVPGLARDLADERRLEDQVGPQHPQVPVRGVLVVQRDLGHDRVERDRSGVVRDHKGAALRRDVLEPGRLDAEPRPVERADQAEEHAVGELGVEAEVVDAVVARQPPAGEVEPALLGRVLDELGQLRGGGRLGLHEHALPALDRHGRLGRIGRISVADGPARVGFGPVLPTMRAAFDGPPACVRAPWPG